MIPVAIAGLGARLLGWFLDPKVLLVLIVAGVTVSGWALAHSRGKTIARQKAEIAEFRQAYERVAAVAEECNRATVAAEAAARKTQAAAAQAIARAAAAARTYEQQAAALRAATSPPERSCEAAAAEIRKGLGP